jgi:hypothetical protein
MTVRAPARTPRCLFVLAAVAAGLVLPATAAHAGCHAFTVSVSNAAPREGSTITVTVRRDGNVEPSAVRVRTVAQSATSGTDFEPLDEEIAFSNELQQQRTVRILADAAREPSESFRLELSDGSGCGDAELTYGPPATVTIQNVTAAATLSPTPTPTPFTSVPPRPTPSRSTTTAVASTTPPASRVPTTSAPPGSPSGSPSASPSAPLSSTAVAAPSESADMATDDAASDDGLGLAMIALVVGGLVAAGGAALYLRRRGAA